MPGAQFCKKMPVQWGTELPTSALRKAILANRGEEVFRDLESSLHRWQSLLQRWSNRTSAWCIEASKRIDLGELVPQLARHAGCFNQRPAAQSLKCGKAHSEDQRLHRLRRLRRLRRLHLSCSAKIRLMHVGRGCNCPLPAACCNCPEAFLLWHRAALYGVLSDAAQTRR